MPPRSPSEFHPQDWALIVKALASWAGNPNDKTDPREERAYELIDALQELANEVEGTPTVAQMDEQGEYSSHPYRRVFGGWAEALEAAGVNES